LPGQVFGAGKVLDGFLPGMLVLVAFGAGMGAGWVVIGELDNGIIERFRVTPASSLAFAAGCAVADAVIFFVPATLAVLVAWAFGFDLHLGGLVVALVLLVLLTAAISAASTALGLKLKMISSLAAVVTSVQLPLTLLAGVLLPISLGPIWLRGLAHINPLYYTTEAARALCRGEFTSAAAVAFGVAGALLLAAVAWSGRAYRHAAT
jgi:ABC-2 type transport system permease protein